MADNNSIFSFADTFNIISVFGNWQQPKKNILIENFEADFPKLLNFLKDNQNKGSVEFNYTTYYSPDVVTTDLPDGQINRITVKPFLYTDPNGNESKTLNLSATLNTKRSFINLKQSPDLVCHIENEKTEFTLIYNYDRYATENEEEKVAIKISATGFNDFGCLLEFLKIDISEYGKEKLKRIFLPLFRKAESDADKLDWLYEQAPNFVLLERTDQQLWKDLVLLSKRTINSSGTNENQSILNLISAVKNKKWFFDQVNNDPLPIQTILEEFSTKYIPYLIKSVTLIGYQVWEDKDFQEAASYLFGIQEADTDLDGFNESHFAGAAGYDKSRKRYQIGTVYSYFEKGNFIGDPKFTPEGNDFLPYAAVKVIFEDEKNDIYLPAFIAGYFTNIEINKQKRIIVGNALSVVLPELYAVKFKNFINFNWLQRLKKITTTEQLIKFLNNIKDGFKVPGLEKVGIKALFRGTTRSTSGKLYSGNPNTISNGISTSTDPIRATIFAIESSTRNGTKGVVQVAVPSDLKEFVLIAPNRRVSLELEVVIRSSAENFSKVIVKEIPVEKARMIVKELYNIQLPSKINTRVNAELLLRETRILSLEESLKFLNAIKKLK